VTPTRVSEHVQSRSLVPKWYSGNIYDLEQAPPQIIDLPVVPSLADPTTYDLFVSGDYEVAFWLLDCSYSALTSFRYGCLEIHVLIQPAICQF